MTDQEFFDRAAKHILEQGEPAMNGGHCAYRIKSKGGKELRCAIGCFIPDELYSPEFEGHGVMAPMVLDALEPIFGNVNTMLLDRVQQAHDNVARIHSSSPKFIQHFKERMKQIAQAHKLNTDILKESLPCA